MSSTVRISLSSQKLLKELSSRLNEPMQAVLDKALESFRREQFLKETNAAYGSLRQSPRAWKEEQAERKAWDVSLSDGIED
ncbi:MAG: toxin-antitoxin system protein [Elusimicrobia bacterium]|nr:toxin-antitoxin system protein [Elusimicrobiota bacterium]